MIIDGKKIKEDIFKKIKEDILSLSFTPVFCDILVGNDFASKKYVSLKKQNAESLGIKFYDAFFDENINTEGLIEEIKKINNMENICGIIIQLPLPFHIDKEKVLNAIDPKLDVDCLSREVSDEFYKGEPSFSPPTALACIEILNSLNINLENKIITVIGEGILVGKPVCQLLKSKNLNFKVVNSKTIDKDEIIKNSDILITGVGQGKIIKGEMLKDNVIIIDAGTSEENNSLVGDVDFEEAKGKASYITPVPGGVGPVTLAMLFSNILKVAKNKNE